MPFSTPHTTSPFATKLELPVNPSHHLDSDPSDQPEYANPVTANNYEIVYSNALLDLTDRKVAINKRILAAKKTLRQAERALDKFQTDLLRNFPPKPAQVKTLKMQEAYIAQRASDAGLDAQFLTLVEAVDEAQDRLDDLTVAKAACSDWIETIQTGGEHIRTFLAFYKDEARRHGFGGPGGPRGS